jgi:hypothetical protein
MDENTYGDAAFFAYLDAREAALNAAVGCFLTNNVPVEHLRGIVEHTTEDTIKLAAKVALHWKRGSLSLPRRGRP